MKRFYTKIVEIDSLIHALDELDFDEDEKQHLADLIDGTIHHTILGEILSLLSDEDKKVFIRHLETDDHDQIWQFLNSRVENIEGRIKKTADDLKEELHKDIAEAKEKKGEPF